jgi:hypothetical protein
VLAFILIAHGANLIWDAKTLRPGAHGLPARGNAFSVVFARRSNSRFDTFSTVNLRRFILIQITGGW